jgi:prepilin-type N-terminal cleavage/methylation domain-containing protein
MKKKSSGFTLIELLLVISLMSIAVGVTSDILVSLVRTYNKSQVINEIEQNANFVSQKLTKELRNAAQVTYLNPSGTTPPATGDAYNEITFVDRQGNTINYKVNNGIIYRNVGSGDEALTTNVAPSGVNATCISGVSCFVMVESNPQVVRISISLSQAGTPGNAIFEDDITIEDTVVIRDTY